MRTVTLSSVPGGVGRTGMPACPIVCFPMSESCPSNPSAPEPGEPLLDDVAVMLAPLVRWLIAQGVPLAGLTTTLRQLYLDEARDELARRGRRVTDSAVSVLTGVHRKEVKAHLQARREGGRPAARLSPTPAAMLFTRWITDPDFREAGLGEREPSRPMRVLARQGPAPSFESLARDVSSDVHPRTLLAELERLGLVRVEGDEVHRLADRFVISGRDRAAVQAMAVNVADHLATAVHNLGCEEPAARRLEQSVFAEGLSEAAVAELGDLARALWAPALETMAREAGARLRAEAAAHLAGEHESATDGDTAPATARLRFGVYYHHEMQNMHVRQEE